MKRPQGMGTMDSGASAPSIRARAPECRTFHHATYDRIRDYLACGWMIVMPNAPMHHHHYGVIVEWRCDCKLARPI